MQRSHYILAFMALATAFVPVLVSFGLIAFIVPTVWVLGSAAAKIFSLDWGFGLAYLLYSALYLALFYGLSRLSFWLFAFVRPGAVRVTLQFAALLGLFACSFLRELTYSSIQGRGGTYTFWSAVDRYFERRHQQASQTSKTSADWELSQISLHGEWYPSVALSGAAESLEDYLNRTDLSAVPPRTLTLYLDHVLSEQILLEHQAAYAAALDEIFARAETIASARGITLKRGIGHGDIIMYRVGDHDAVVRDANARPRLALTTQMPEGRGLSITVTNIVCMPFTRARYGKDFRGPLEFIKEEPIQW